MKFKRGKLIVLGSVVGATCLSAETADIPAPASRVQVVATVSSILESRGKVVTLPADSKNPFFAKSPAIVQPEVKYSQPPVGLSGPELLSQLSAKIPSTGTLIFGGNAMLLLGSKKAKVGDKISVSNDGIDYELTLVNVTSTSFTVKLGESLSTRPVRNR